MGVQPLTPGFERILIKPQPGDLKWAKLKTPTIRGSVKVMIDQEPGKSIRLSTVTPANTMTRVMIPVGESKSTSVLMNGKLVHGVLDHGFLKIDDVGSGENSFSYHFSQN